MASGFSASFQRELARETLTFYGTGVFIILLRT